MNTLALSDLHFGFSLKGDAAIRRIFEQAQTHQDLEFLVLAGDLISHDQSQWDGFFKILEDFHEAQPTVEIVAVLGNHDRWGKGKVRDLAAEQKSLKDRFDNVNGYLLDEYEGVHLSPGLWVIGHSGYYGQFSKYLEPFHPSETNDQNFLPKEQMLGPVPIGTHAWLDARATDSMLKNIEHMRTEKDNGSKVVYVSHHPMDKILKHFVDDFDLYLFGHEHNGGKCLEGIPPEKYMCLAGDYEQPKENWLTI